MWVFARRADEVDKTRDTSRQWNYSSCTWLWDRLLVLCCGCYTVRVPHSLHYVQTFLYIPVRIAYTVQEYTMSLSLQILRCYWDQVWCDFKMKSIINFPKESDTQMAHTHCLFYFNKLLSNSYWSFCKIVRLSFIFWWRSHKHSFNRYFVLAYSYIAVL